MAAGARGGRTPGPASASTPLRPADATVLASDQGPAPMNLGAVVLVAGGARLDPGEVVAELGVRAAGIPVLGRHLAPRSPVWGRPAWEIDARFRAVDHLSVVDCLSRMPPAAPPASPAPQAPRPGPGRLDATGRPLLDFAARRLCARLDPGRPLWHGWWVADLPGGDAALVLVLHHVLADGLGGLAVLAALADGGIPDRGPAPCPASAQSPPRSRARSFADGVRELRAQGRPRLAPRISLNRPTGPLRRLSTVDVSVAHLVERAHRHGGTVNDVVVSAVVGALGSVLHDRGEAPDRLVVSMPVSARRAATSAEAGNATGVRPVSVPLCADPDERLQHVVASTAAARDRRRGASAAPLGVAIRLLVRAGAFRWFVDHQRLVNSFVSNVRGPAQPVALAGHPVRALVPMSAVPGNVAVAVDVLSYAGQLTACVVADPDVLPEQDALTDLLARELA